LPQTKKIESSALSIKGTLVFLCPKERERERERGGEKERVRESEREIEREREWGRATAR
jgi:hypothetical protein